MTAGRAWIFATLMIMIGLISMLVVRVFMMMAMTNGHHEEFLRIDEILVIMMMAMMVLMVMACMGCTQIPISTLSHIWVFVRLYGIVYVIIVIIIIIIMII